MIFSINVKSFLLRLSILTLLISFSITAIKAQSPSEIDSLAQKVTTLLEQSKYVEAVPVLEKMLAIQPNDGDLHFYYAFSLLGKAKTLENKEEIRLMRVTARNEFLKAKKLGSTQATLDAFVAGIPEDGAVVGKFSNNSEADEIMEKAETVFVKGNIDEALTLYKKALEIDPTIYEAALFAGDMYIRKDDFANAEIWFQKAIKINPDRETAYRYSATPLMRQKKYDQARERYIEAFISEPYSRFAAIGLGQWADATGAKLGHPVIDIPTGVSSDEKGNTTITLDSMLGKKGKEDAGAAWLMYGITRSLWRTKKFAEKFPKEANYRHSLAEEFDALQTVLIVADETNAKNKKKVKLTPALSLLKELNNKGLLESYILLAKPDNGIAQDYAAYLQQNRAKLKQYINEYVIRK